MDEINNTYAENLMKQIRRIDIELENLETYLREHPENNSDGSKTGLQVKISEQIRRTRKAMFEIDEEANRLLVYAGAKICTYRKTATVKAERFWPVDNDKIDYYRAKYGITQLGDLSDDEISSLKPTAGTQVCYMGDDSYVIPTLEGNMTINNGDWILTGVDGEHWAVKYEIFNKTYEKVTDQNDD